MPYGSPVSIAANSWCSIPMAGSHCGRLVPAPSTRGSSTGGTRSMQVAQARTVVELGWLAQHAPARDLDVAHQGVEDQRGAAHVERLPVTRRHPTGMEDHVRRVGDDLVDEPS